MRPVAIEGDDTYSVYIFNPALKRRLADFSKKYPAHCCLDAEDKTIGLQSYVISKGRLSIRLTALYSDERRRAASDRAKITRLKLEQTARNRVKQRETGWKSE